MEWSFERAVYGRYSKRGEGQWNGELLKGAGKASTSSGVLRELIAADHASCFSMILAKVLGDQKKLPKDIATKATLSLSQQGGGGKNHQNPPQNQGQW